MPLTPTINGAYVDLVTMTPGAVTAHYTLATLTSGAVTTLYPQSGNATYNGVATYAYSNDTTAVTTVVEAVQHVQQQLAGVILQQEGLSSAAGDTILFAS